MSLASLPITFFCGSFNTNHDFSIEHSKDYFYQPRVKATIDNNKALTQCCESIEVWPGKIELTLLLV